MKDLQTLLNTACDEWDLGEPQRVARTPRAEIYKVRYQHEDAALKLALPIIGDDESRAPDWLDWIDGSGAPCLYESAPDRVLMEWIDGPHLASLCKEDDAQATEILADCARSLWSKTKPFPGAVLALESATGALLSLDIGKIPAPYRTDFDAARTLCQQLIDSTETARVLHGDLHHGNIAHSPRGWLAFDPKVYFGDPHFEFANSYRNPFDPPALLADPDRPVRMSAVFASKLGLDQRRLLQWGFVLSALSVCWEFPRSSTVSANIKLVPMMRNLAN